MIEEGLTLYFYHWLKVDPVWKISGKLSKEDISYKQIWEQATSRFLFQEVDITRLKKGEIFRFDIEDKFIRGYDIHTLHQSITTKEKKYCISICPVCKKAVNIHLSRVKKLCPNCDRESKSDKQRIRRAIKKGRNFCKSCGKLLPKEYPNRDYCPGGACKQKMYRKRKEKESWLKSLEDLEVFG